MADDNHDRVCEDVWSLPEGRAVFRCPYRLTPEDAELIEEWFALLLRGIKRRVASPAPGGAEGEAG